ncbi:hypothetical protein D3C77_645630 [compost metagenome]
MAKQQLAVGGGLQAAGVALEQRGADILLQLLEPFRQPRLGGVGDARGVAEAAGFGQADQQMQVTQAQAAAPVDH